MKRHDISHAFVEDIPEVLNDNTLYISIAHATAMHKCFCGCGSEVVTPISPVWWTLTFDGKSVSLDPSVGSWEIPCRSHYWITRNQVELAPAWSRERISRQRSTDRGLRKTYLEEGQRVPGNVTPGDDRRGKVVTSWQAFKRLFKS